MMAVEEACGDAFFMIYWSIRSPWWLLYGDTMFETGVEMEAASPGHMPAPYVRDGVTRKLDQGHMFAKDVPWLGTDSLGRDLAAGLLYGARTTLLVGVVATVIACVLGFAIGGLAGYFGGRLDNLLMRFTELFQTIPLFLFILLVAVLGPSLRNVIFAIAVVSWPPMARLVRGEFMAMRNREFVQACVSLGMGHTRIILVHILPNTLSSIIVTGSLMVATAILIESGLST